MSRMLFKRFRTKGPNYLRLVFRQRLRLRQIQNNGLATFAAPNVRPAKHCRYMLPVSIEY